MFDLIPLLIFGAGILQLPLLMDVIQHLWPESRIGRAVTRGMRALLVACMLFCATAALHTQVATLLPEHVRDPTPASGQEDAATWFLRPAALAHLLLSAWIYVQMVAHFWAACRQQPSRIRPQPPTLQHLQQAPSLPTTANGADGDASTAAAAAAAPGAGRPKTVLVYGGDGVSSALCSKCMVPKLLRTHHCNICGVCVELMDHHCPFTGNCVGRANFRVFYLWLCYGLLGLTYAVVMSFGPFARCVWTVPRVATPADGAGAAERRAAWVAQHSDACERLGRAAYVFLPAFFGWMSTLFVWVMQSLLLRRDVTTIEYLKNVAELSVRMRAPDDVQQDREQRDRERSQRKRRKQANGDQDRDRAADGEEDDADEGMDVGADGDGAGPVDVESGTPLAASSPQELHQSGASLIAATAAYNPHKSFQLVWQHLPLWTVLLPPFVVEQWQRRAGQAHRRRQIGAK